MNICFVVNKNYIGQLKVALKSLFSSNKDNIEIYLLQNDLNDEDKKDLQRYVTSFNQKINFIQMDDSLFIGLPKMGYDSSYTAYFKIMIPYVLNQLNKVLYLDCDLLIEKELSSLYNSERKHFISAVLDEKVNKNRKEHVKNICEKEYDTYFNSGVILFDFFHKDEIISKEEMFDYIIKNKEIIKFHDQDILNHFYIEKNDILPEKYNYVTTYKSVKDVFFHKDGKKAYIIHYANWKPWNPNYIGKYYKKYKNIYKSIKKDENLRFLKRRNVFSMCKLIIDFIKKR